MTASSCITYGWLKYLGFAVVFGSLIVKPSGFPSWWYGPSFRHNVHSSTIRYKLDSDGMVSSVEATPFCNFTSYNYVCLAAMVLTLVYGVFLAYAVRNTPGAFNESKWIAYSIYNWVVIGIVLNAIANFAVTNPDIIFVMEALVVIITQTGVVLPFFFFYMALRSLICIASGPKLMIISNGSGDEVDTFQSSSTNINHGETGKSSTNSVSRQTDQNVDLLKQRVQMFEVEITGLNDLVNEKQKEIDELLGSAKS
ncbi:hypothetical protein HDU97_000145 [Phlyctochytrium planicorne]|nr:hypothetical protein HDU97_000145 [Phlyctochytrium planicorne]